MTAIEANNKSLVSSALFFNWISPLKTLFTIRWVLITQRTMRYTFSPGNQKPNKIKPTLASNPIEANFAPFTLNFLFQSILGKNPNEK